MKSGESQQVQIILTVAIRAEKNIKSNADDTAQALVDKLDALLQDEDFALKNVATSYRGASLYNVEDDPDAKNPFAVALGRLGGLKGGPARAASLSPTQRSESAKKAAKARWSKR
jgi:hypothetical protein